MHSFFSEPKHQPFTIGSGRLGALLIHGFPGTPAEMRPLAARLAAADFTVYGPLLPGFGPDIPHLGETDRATWLAAVRDQWTRVRRRHDQAVLVGFSMGAALAIHTAVEQPPQALVLLAPFWQLGGWEAKALPLLKYVFRKIRPFAKADFSDPAVRKQMYEIAPEIDLDNPETQEALRQQIVLPTVVVDEVRRLGAASYDLAPQLASPTLVLQGQDDNTVQPAATRRLLAQVGGTLTYHEFPGDHAFVKMSQAASYDFAGDVLRFLSRHLRPDVDLNGRDSDAAQPVGLTEKGD